MNTRAQRTLKALHAVQDFFNAAEPALYPLPFAPAVRVVDLGLARIHMQLAAQSVISARQRILAGKLHALRTKTRVTIMQPLGAIARAQLKHIEDLRALRVPGRRATNGELARAAHRFAEVAGRHIEGFTRAGLDPRAVGELHELGTALNMLEECRQITRALADKAAHVVTGMIDRSREDIAIVDALVRSTLRGNRRLWARWCRVRTLCVVGV